jgi:hypothetical protein
MGGAGSGGAGGGGAGAGGSYDAAVNGGSCSFTACGGNIVGTWHVTTACGSISPSSCPPPQSIVVEHETSQATYTFAADGTFTNLISGAFSETYRYPFSCLDGGTDQVCADYQDMVQTSIARADGGLSGATYTCSADVNQTCLCTETFTYPSPQTQTTSYVVNGDQVILGPSVDGGVADAGAYASVEYCVSGNTLTLHFVGASSVTGDFVITLSK